MPATRLAAESPSIQFTRSATADDIGLDGVVVGSLGDASAVVFMRGPAIFSVSAIGIGGANGLAVFTCVEFSKATSVGRINDQLATRSGRRACGGRRRSGRGGCARFRSCDGIIGRRRSCLTGGRRSTWRRIIPTVAILATIATICLSCAAVTPLRTTESISAWLIRAACSSFGFASTCGCGCLGCG